MRRRAAPGLLSAVKKAGKKYFYRKSKIGRETIEHPGSWKILDRLYGNDPEETATKTFRPVHWTDRMFYQSKAARATRFRFDEYVRLIQSLGFHYAINNGGRVRILSLASGPGRDIIEAAKDLDKKGICVSSVCIDACNDAVGLGTRLARKHRFDNITFVKKNISNIREYEEGEGFDIIVTQGILDYLSHQRAVTLLQNARTLLKNHGTILISNMGRHFWIRFWMEIFGEWRLKYRTADDLRKIMQDAGFRNDEIHVYRLIEGFHWMGMATNMRSVVNPAQIQH